MKSEERIRVDSCQAGLSPAGVDASTRSAGHRKAQATSARIVAAPTAEIPVEYDCVSSASQPKSFWNRADATHAKKLATPVTRP